MSTRSLGKNANAVTGFYTDLDLARGVVADHFVVHKYGRAIVDNTPRALWTPNDGTGGAIDVTWLTTPDNIRIAAGGNAADDQDGGAGALQINTMGLDTNFNLINEDLIPEGADASNASTNIFSRIYRSYVNSVGTYHGTNVGKMVIETDAGSPVTMAQIDAGKGQTQMAVYTVPAGWTAFLTYLHIHVDTNTTADIKMLSYENADDVSSPFSGGVRVRVHLVGLSGDNHMKIKSHIKFNEKTDIWLTGSVGASTSDVTAEFELIVVKNLT